MPADGAADVLRGRLAALGEAHSLLAAGRWEGADLRALLDAELAPYGGGQRRRIRLSGERVLLRPRLAQTLALVVHELATNAAKYGALSTSEGRVAVTWTVEQQSDVPRLSLAWSEAGGPPVAPPSRRGFGTLLVERSVAYELDGDLRLEFLPPGVRCEITLLLP